MIIAFNWTTLALISDRKTVTRRDWKVQHAAKFHRGQLVDAYDYNPRNHGRKIAEILIEQVTWEPISSMPSSDYEQEGFAFLFEHYAIEAASIDAFESWRALPDRWYWVVRFQLMDVDDIVHDADWREHQERRMRSASGIHLRARNR